MVPSLLVFVVLCCLVFMFGLNTRYLPYSGHMVLGYVVTMCSVALAPAGWFRMATSLGHSIVIGQLVALGVTSAFLGRWSAELLLDWISVYPTTALAIAAAIWLLEKGLRLSGLSGRLD